MNSVAYEVHESLGLDGGVGVDRTLTYEVLYVEPNMRPVVCVEYIYVCICFCGE